MKNKKIFIPIIALLVIYYGLKFFNFIGVYTISSPSMEPNYSDGKYIFATSFVTPRNGDVICYKSIMYAVPGHREEALVTKIGRMVASENDDLQLKDGYVFINGQPTEEKLNLRFLYPINEEQMSLNIELLKQCNSDVDFHQWKQIKMLYLDDNLKDQFSGHELLVKVDRSLSDMISLPGFEPYPEMNPDWTISNYGSITIPVDHVFILGDNRNNSEDSRYLGFVHEDDIVGVVMN